MADDTSTKSKVHYYRSKLSGLSVIVGGATSDNPEPQYVRFNAFLEKEAGDPIKVGYLATDNEIAIERLAQDPNVEEIDQSEYKKCTDDTSAKVTPLPR